MGLPVWSVVALIAIIGHSAAEVTEYDKNINFLVYTGDNQVFNWTTQTNDFEAANCSIGEPLSFIVPGWKEDTTATEWIPEMVQNLKLFRGGCIVVVDYYYYSKNVDYFGLRLEFDCIAKVLLKEYLAFQMVGHEPEDVFFFGFSYGAQLSLDVGREVNELHNGSFLIGRMDVCEPTGVGFINLDDSKLSADNVQCIHTNSVGFGTLKRDCHQDWNMGSCGNYQAANGPYPKGHHGLCPYFYNSAFANNFFATKKALLCVAKKEAKTWPPGFKMGYNEHRFNYTGEFFAETTKTEPYSKVVAQNTI